MRYRIEHRTHYLYSGPVSRCRNEAHLRPRDTDRQTCVSSELVVDPIPTSWSDRTDFYNNPVASFVVDGPFTEMTVVASSLVDVIDGDPLPATGPDWGHALDLLVYDPANPRSVLFQLDRLVAHLAELPKRSSVQRLGNEERLALEATTLLRLNDPERLAFVNHATGRRTELDSVFATVDGLLGELLDSLSRTYFAHERLSALAGGQTESIGGGP